MIQILHVSYPIFGNTNIRAMFNSLCLRLRIWVSVMPGSTWGCVSRKYWLISRFMSCGRTYWKTVYTRLGNTITFLDFAAFFKSGLSSLSGLYVSSRTSTNPEGTKYWWKLSACFRSVSICTYFTRPTKTFFRFSFVSAAVGEVAGRLVYGSRENRCIGLPAAVV